MDFTQTLMGYTISFVEETGIQYWLTTVIQFIIPLIMSSVAIYKTIQIDKREVKTKDVQIAGDEADIIAKYKTLTMETHQKMSDMQDEHLAEITKLENSHRTRICELEDNHRLSLEKLERSYKDTLNNLKEGYSELEEKYDNVIRELRTQKQNIEQLQADNVALAKANFNLKKDNEILIKDNATLKRDNATLRNINTAYLRELQKIGVDTSVLPKEDHNEDQLPNV